MCIVEPPQHARLITMLPLSAPMLIFPPLLAGQKQEVDFDAPLQPALLQGIIFRPVDDSPSAIPWALR